VLLPLELQQTLLETEPAVFARLNGAWGARGWTRVDLTRVDEPTCVALLREAYDLAAPRPKADAKAKPKAVRAKAKPDANANAKPKNERLRTKGRRVSGTAGQKG
jgi:hypothetical protein